MKRNTEMEKKRRTRFRLFFLLFFSAAVSMIWYAAWKTEILLVIRDGKTGQLLWHAEVKQGEIFTLQWLHSINGTPVIETYTVDGERLVLTAMRFKDYGVGIPTELAPGERIVQQDGFFYVTGMHRVHETLNLSVAQVVQSQVLEWRGNKIPLSDIQRPGRLVRMGMERISILQQIGGF